MINIKGDYKKLTILIDMDDTIENLVEVWVKILNYKYGTNVRYIDVNDWDIKKCFPKLTEAQISEPLSMEGLWKMVQPFPGASKYIKRLIDDGHKVYIVTASSPETIKMKLDLVLFKYFPYLTYKDVIVTSNKQMIRGDVMVDDAPHNLINGSYLRILKDSPPNFGYDAESNCMIRASDWEDIYKIISKYAILEQLNENLSINI